MDPHDLDGSFQVVLPRLMNTVSGAQSAAAQVGAEYVPLLRSELNIRDRVEGDVRVEALVGVSSTGIPLESALSRGVIDTKTAIATGVAPRQALLVGGARLMSRIQTEVADAGRIAASVDAIGDKSITLYTRMLVPPSCSRCALLAGATYRMSEAFARHPQCDCRHIPCNEDTFGDLTSDPKEYFDSLPSADELDEQYPGMTVKERRNAGHLSQEDVFTRAGAQAIRDGANVGQVVNARKGMYTTRGGNLATRAGSTRRGIWGSSQTEFDKVTGSRYRTARRHRIMPETIYGLTNDRDEQIRLLKYYRFMF